VHEPGDEACGEEEDRGAPERPSREGLGSGLRWGGQAGSAAHPTVDDCLAQALQSGVLDLVVERHFGKPGAELLELVKWLDSTAWWTR
jgi:hypothetical protein